MKIIRFFFILFTIILFFYCNNNLFAIFTSGNGERVLSSKKGSSIVFVSSNYERASAIFIINERPGGWRSGKKSPFPHMFIFELAGNAKINRLKFLNSRWETRYPGISAKDVQVEFSTVSSNHGYHHLENFRLEKKTDDQEFKIEETEARWIRLTINSNYGNSNYTEMMEFEAWGKFDFKVLPLLLNFIWILGAALILFNFSLHGFIAHSTSVKFRKQIQSPSFERLFLTGLILVSLGICVSVNNFLAVAAAGGFALFLIILFIKKLTG
jgi:hypothetical protein